ncbi:helix-turn-helix transcriptional regulator [Streptosporangium subroseum]|uniref:PadR family transcriptional regulator n=1 Tax=Streptosporangium subroseum TaxID=106412 RepID=UPI003438C614
MALREQSYLILLALSRGPLHGYGMIKTVRELSEDRVRLGAGTLYGALDRLTGEGLVIVVKEEVVDGRHRRYYDLTGHGQQVLAEETTRLSRLVTAARRRLDLQPGIGA